MLLLHRRILCRISSFSLQIPFRNSSPTKMNRGSRGGLRSQGRGSRPSGNLVFRIEPVGADGPHPSVSHGDKDGFTQDRTQMSQQSSPAMLDAHRQGSSFPKKGPSYTESTEQARYSGLSAVTKMNESVSDSNYDAEYPPLALAVPSGSREKFFGKLKTETDLGLEQRKKDINSSQLERLQSVNSVSQQNESSLPTQPWKKGISTHLNSSQSKQSYSKKSVPNRNTNSSDGLDKLKPFDICLPRNRDSHIRAVYQPKHNRNQEETEQTIEGLKQGHLRPGMVLLKSYLTHTEQIEIVKTCQELGLGPRGFYRPGYKDGAKLLLQMMCLGLNWDPQTKYGRQRPGEDCETSDIPHEFDVLVQRAIWDAHALMKKNLEISNVEDTLPGMRPNICIVNFYTTSGRLGLHQDRDESRESIKRGLPVVSFSVGDSAEFLYGDDRNVDEAEKVILESGDVLIFGGESRLIFHGVSSIIPNSAPQALLQETNLRAGRLNLTFRQF